MATIIHIKKGIVPNILQQKNGADNTTQSINGFKENIVQQLRMLESLTAIKQNVGKVDNSVFEVELPQLKEKFDAKKFTGKIASFGNAMDFQKKLRNEW